MVMGFKAHGRHDSYNPIPLVRFAFGSFRFLGLVTKDILEKVPEINNLEGLAKFPFLQ